MKRILAFALPLAMLFTTQSCEKRQVATHNTQWDSTGNDSIVRIQGQDENGNMMTYFLAYTLFNNLFNRGGYTAVNNYYQHNRASIDASSAKYRSYTHTVNPKSGIDLTKVNKGSVNTSNAYRKSSPTYTKDNQPTTTYRKSSPTYNKTAPSTSYRTSSPTYKSTSTSSYRISSPTYKSSSSSSSSYRSSSPSYRSSSSSSSSYRSSSPSYRNSSSYSSSSSSYRSSSPGRR